MICKICVVTGGRADYGLLRLLMKEIKRTRRFKLQVLATGVHFEKKFGSTFREILKDGFRIDAKVKMASKEDSAVGLGKAMGAGIRGIANALAELRPDLVILLGDRYEIHGTAAVATLAGVPLAHVHGGELTEGSYDDAFRHAITKMSHLHFVSTEIYRKRVIQMGEQPKRVFNVGALGVDNVLAQNFLSRRELEKSLGLRLRRKNLLITFHPATLESGQAGKQIKALLQALSSFAGVGMIFTMPGADKGNVAIWKEIRAYAKTRPHVKTFQALGSSLYLSLMKQVDAVVGNSSSGLLEAPVLKKPAVNIGDRQRGRVRSPNVIDCGTQPSSIRRAIRQALSAGFAQGLSRLQNPHGNGAAAKKIISIISRYRGSDLSKKSFFDLPK